MRKQKDSIDIVNELLEQCIIAYPVSSFIIGLYKQYGKWGSLSKKQLQGLYAKAAEIEGMAPGKLATLEALIKKMRTKDTSEASAVIAPSHDKDAEALQVMNDILAKYPQHKRVLFLKAKYDNNEPVSSLEIAELIKFKQALKIP